MSAKPHRHDCFNIVWYKKGTGTTLVDFKAYDNLDGRMFFIRPGQVHQVLNNSVKEGFVMMFTEDYLPKDLCGISQQVSLSVFDEFNICPYIDVPKAYFPVFDHIIALMYTELEPSKTPSFILLSNYLQIFLLNVNREEVRLATQEQLSDGQTSRILKLGKLFSKNFKQHHDNQFYAATMALTPKRLNEIVKSATGKTFTTMLHERLMVEAKRMLMFTDSPVKEISWELGFQDPAYFSRFFRKNEGMSPIDFREKGSNSTSVKV